MSVAIVLIASLGASALLMAHVGPIGSVALAFGDALLFTGSLRLVDGERYRVVGFAVAGIGALFVGGVFVVAVGFTSLQLLSSLFPATSIEQVRPHGLEIISATAVVGGGTLAMIGGLTTVDNALRADTVWAYAKLAVKTFAVPLAVATLMLFSTVLGSADGDPSAPLLSPLSDVIDGGLDALVSPVPGRTHLFTFCALLFVTAAVVERAVDALPVAELAGKRSNGGPEAVADVVRLMSRRTALLLATVLPFTLVEVVVSPSEVESLLPATVYEALAGITASQGLRSLLAVVFVVALAALVVSWSARRVSRTGAHDVAVQLTPFVGGAGVVALVAALHDAVLDPAIEFVAFRLPGAYAGDFSDYSHEVVDFYGSLAITMTLAAMLVGLTALLSLALALVTSGGLLPERAAAPALAGGGTFLAAAFAAGVGVDAPVVLTGLVAGLLAWDVGEYGVTLGREIGRRTGARGPQLVHAGATVAVGVVGAIAALFLSGYALDVASADDPTVPFAIAAVLAGLFLIVAALR